jgi:hypothetical protein
MNSLFQAVSIYLMAWAYDGSICVGGNSTGVALLAGPALPVTFKDHPSPMPMSAAVVNDASIEPGHRHAPVTVHRIVPTPYAAASGVLHHRSVSPSFVAPGSSNVGRHLDDDDSLVLSSASPVFPPFDHDELIAPLALPGGATASPPNVHLHVHLHSHHGYGHPSLGSGANAAMPLPGVVSSAALNSNTSSLNARTTTAATTSHHPNVRAAMASFVAMTAHPGTHTPTAHNDHPLSSSTSTESNTPGSTSGLGSWRRFLLRGWVAVTSRLSLSSNKITDEPV